jgi:hypothetical protein
VRGNQIDSDRSSTSAGLINPVCCIGQRITKLSYVQFRARTKVHASVFQRAGHGSGNTWRLERIIFGLAPNRRSVMIDAIGYEFSPIIRR